MSYSDDWFANLRHKREIERRWPKPVEPAPVESTTWKPWAEMTAEERRKALAERKP